METKKEKTYRSIRRVMQIIEKEKSITLKGCGKGGWEIPLYTDLIPSMVEAGIIKADGSGEYIENSDTPPSQSAMATLLLLARRDKQKVQREVKKLEKKLGIKTKPKAKKKLVSKTPKTTTTKTLEQRVARLEELIIEKLK